MERSNQLKRERTQLRRSFTKICHDLDSLLKDKLSIKEDVMSCLNQLEDKSDRLHILDEQIREKLLADDVGDEEFEAEWNSVESFREESIKYKTRCTSYLNEATKREEIVSNANSTSLGVGRRNFKLPKLELKRFDGEVKNWIGFWGQFRKIHEDSTIDKEDKFQYLIQSIEQGSTARELVESFPPSGDNYEKAVEQLKNRFARDEFLIEVYVRELLNLVLKQSMTNKAGMSLSNLFDKLETQLRALETLGVTSDKYAAMLYPLAESALPEDILKVWERYRSSIVRDHPGESSQNSITNNISGENVHKNPTNHLNLLLDFLKAEVESEERIKLARTSFSQGKESGKSHNYQKVKPHLSNIPELNTAATIFTSEKKKGKKVMNCIFCDRSHSSQDCLSANKLTFDEKKDMVIKKNCCFGCLKPNHNVRFCKYFIKCLLCGKKHFTLMCPDLPSNKSVNDNVNGSQKEQLGDTENVLTSLNSCTETLLQTVIVRLVKDGKSLLVRALLDSASQRSYILSSYAKQMNFIKVREETIIQGVFGGSETQAHAHSLFDVSIESLDKSFQLKFVALDQTRICNHIPRLHNKKYIDYLKRKNIIISDSDSKLTEIVILLGADVIGNLFTGIIEKVDEDLFAIETRLGWTLMGKQQKISDSFPISSLCSFQIPDLWSLEVLGIRDSSEIKTKEHLETETIQNFNETIILTDENRYQVSLPWVKGHPKLLNNFDIAEKRLFNVTKKLRDNNRYSEYEQVFQEWEKLDIIERVPENEMEKSVYYLPHHAVIKDSSATTKIRPVFDASAKDKKDHSLNDCLEKGPNLIELIPKILLQFRLGAIGVIADIKKAFLQISLKEEDRDFLRFLWWEDQKNNKKVTFRHRRVVFGVSSSPFLLAATINYHLERVPDNLKETARKLKNSFYVDNCVASVENMSDLLRFKEESTRIMSSARFELRGWIHSFGNSNDDITCKENVCSVLGLSWNFKNDTIFCDTNSLTEVNDIPRTKRGLLSISQRIFDPIGFTCPVTLTPKLLLQKTWQLKLGWDKKLPENIVKDFENWLKQIPWLTFCIVPRHICDCPLNDTINTLHVFCDSSKTAYATCIFLRSEKNGVVSLKLIQAKARIAPIKPITLPRLELLAAVIGVRLCQSVKKVEIFSSMKAYYWSDSMVVLSWIKSKEDWNTFVGNRVKEICSVSDPVDWFHVPGIMNIADLPSRGCSAKNLAETKWWNGPEWLRKNSEFWPKSEIFSQPFRTIPPFSFCEIFCTTSPRWQIRNIHNSRYMEPIYRITNRTYFFDSITDKSVPILFRFDP